MFEGEVYENEQHKFQVHGTVAWQVQLTSRASPKDEVSVLSTATEKKTQNEYSTLTA